MKKTKKWCGKRAFEHYYQWNDQYDDDDDDDES